MRLHTGVFFSQGRDWTTSPPRTASLSGKGHTYVHHSTYCPFLPQVNWLSFPEAISHKFPLLKLMIGTLGCLDYKLAQFRPFCLEQFSGETFSLERIRVVRLSDAPINYEGWSWSCNYGFNIASPSSLKNSFKKRNLEENSVFKKGIGLDLGSLSSFLSTNSVVIRLYFSVSFELVT